MRLMVFIIKISIATCLMVFTYYYLRPFASVLAQKNSHAPSRVGLFRPGSVGEAGGTIPRPLPGVIPLPEKAKNYQGIQCLGEPEDNWIPAFAGMTI